MKFSFQVMVTNDNRTGKILSVYFRIRSGKAAQVKEFQDGAAFANYNHKGELIGIELLAPCQLAVLDKISKSEPKAQLEVRRFVRGNMPRDMVLSASSA